MLRCKRSKRRDQCCERDLLALTSHGKPDAVQCKPRKMTSFRNFWAKVMRRGSKTCSQIFRPGETLESSSWNFFKIIACFQKLRKLVNNCASGCTKPQNEQAHKKDAAPRGTASEREDESKSRAFAALTVPHTKREQQEVAGQTAARRALRTRGRRAHRKEARCRTKGISLFRANHSPFPTRTLHSGCKTYTPQLPPSLLT